MNKPFKIWVEDKETLKKVLAKMEKEGIKWWMSKTSPTNTIYLGEPIALFVDEDNLLSKASSFVYFKSHPNNEVTPEEYLKENSMRDKFTKDDLRNGMLVKTRGDRVYLYLEYSDDGNNDNCVFVRDTGCISLGFFDYDLTTRSGSRDELDIMEVYKPDCHITNLCLYVQIGAAELIWKREEKPVEMTIAEIEEKLGIKNLKIIKEKE